MSSRLPARRGSSESRSRQTDSRSSLSRRSSGRTSRELVISIPRPQIEWIPATDMCSDHDLAHVKCFGIPARRHALDPADASERPERFSREPRPPQLRRETAHEGVDLAVEIRRRYGHKKVRLPEVALELR